MRVLAFILAAALAGALISPANAADTIRVRNQTQHIIDISVSYYSELPFTENARPGREVRFPPNKRSSFTRATAITAHRLGKRFLGCSMKLGEHPDGDYVVQQRGQDSTRCEIVRQ